jgi:peptidoglycan hydrolase-like protein with peptidoglycan-binding domain
VVTVGGIGVAQANAKEAPEGSLMRPIDVQNCADSGVNRGDRGHCVWILQVALDRQGYNVDTDGRFGPKTQAVVKRFNTDHCIEDLNGNTPSTGTVATFEALADNLTPWAPYQKANAHFYADHV